MSHPEQGRHGSGYSQLDRSDTGGISVEEDTDLNKVLATVDELTAMINQVVGLIEKLKANHAKILTSFQNQGSLACMMCTVLVYTM